MITKDNLVYGLLGTIAGIILGVLIGNNAPQRQVADASAQETPAIVQQQSQNQLPEGHPPIDQTVLRTQLSEQKALLEKDPANQQAILSVANLNFDMKNYSEAAIYYEQALQKDATNINIITDLGTSYFYLNNPTKALDMYYKSLSINGSHLQTLMNIGVVKMSIGDNNGAAEAWEKVVTLYPNIPEAVQLKESILKLRANTK